MVSDIDFLFEIEPFVEAIDKGLVEVDGPHVEDRLGRRGQLATA